MGKARLLAIVAATTTIAAGCQASPVDAASAGPLFGGQTLGSGHRMDGDSSAAASTTSSSETDTRTGNLFGSGT